MTLHKSGNLGELNHNHLTTFGRKVMKRHLKIIGPFEYIISKIKLFIISGIIALNYNCEDASTADNNSSNLLLFDNVDSSDFIIYLISSSLKIFIIVFCN